MRWLLLLPLLVLPGCGDSTPVGNVASGNEAALDLVTPEPVAVRIGEMGANFQACAGAGTTRHLQPGESLPVRSAPFENAAQTGAVAAGGRFFICARSLDQKWFGIVYDRDGALSPRCAVSDPVASRRAYPGPCESGWVSTPFVKTIAGNEPPAPQPNRADPAASPEPKGG
jgi:hypothetical protein